MRSILAYIFSIVQQKKDCIRYPYICDVATSLKMQCARHLYYLPSVCTILIVALFSSWAEFLFVSEFVHKRTEFYKYNPHVYFFKTMTIMVHDKKYEYSGNEVMSSVVRGNIDKGTFAYAILQAPHYCTLDIHNVMNFRSLSIFICKSCCFN